MSSNVNSAMIPDRSRVLMTLGVVCLAISSLATSVRAQDGRPQYFEFSPAYPAVAVDSILPSPISAYTLPWESVLSIAVDSSGAVTSITADSTIDSLSLSIYRDRIASMRFHPATFRGAPCASKLIALLIRYPTVKLFSLRFPLDTSGCLLNHELYMMSAKANDIQSAGIKHFPSYHSVIQNGDSLAMYPYIMLRVRLDTLGRVREIIPVRSTHPSFTQQVISVANWAKYAPARVHGKAVPSDNWLLISFFPHGRYPTVVVTPKNKDRLPLLEQLGVRLIGDTLGLASPPILKRRTDLRVTVPRLSKTRPGWVEAEILVDTLGEVYLTRIGEGRKSIMNDLQKTFKALRFYPAMDMNGNLRDFSGFGRFEFEGSTDIRIEFSWLPRVADSSGKVTSK